MSYQMDLDILLEDARDEARVEGMVEGMVEVLKFLNYSYDQAFQYIKYLCHVSDDEIKNTMNLYWDNDA